MNAKQFRRLRQDKKISILDLAARTGLPEDYIEKIEEEKVVALPSDLARLEKAIAQVEKEKSDPDYEEEPIDPSAYEEE